MPAAMVKRPQTLYHPLLHQGIVTGATTPGAWCSAGPALAVSRAQIPLLQLHKLIGPVHRPQQVSGGLLVGQGLHCAAVL